MAMLKGLREGYEWKKQYRGTILPLAPSQLLKPNSLDYFCFLLRRPTPRVYPAGRRNRKEIRGGGFAAPATPTE